ncbi:MAG: RDD family protein [Chloroflexi bacterium]|nr:RDD family protein [Chloroflexota bacterium]
MGESAYPAATFNYQGVGKRFVALVIDVVIMYIVLIVISLIAVGSAGAGMTPEGIAAVGGGGALIWFLFAVLYPILMEGYLGATVGKMVLGLRVVKEDGSPCGLGAAFIRNLLRIIDGLFGYLVGAILIWNSDKRQRLGDRLAKTVVVAKS